MFVTVMGLLGQSIPKGCHCSDMETITSEKHGCKRWHPEIINYANGSTEILDTEEISKKERYTKKRLMWSIVMAKENNEVLVV